MANSDGSTPMHWACLNGHVEVVRALMSKGASPSTLNTSGRTPVDEALSRDHQVCVGGGVTLFLPLFIHKTWHGGGRERVDDVM